MEDRNAFTPSSPAEGGSAKVDVIEPAVLLLSGHQVLVSKAALEVPLYKMSRDIASIPPKNSSIIFERVEDAHVTGADRNGPEKQQTRHIFYLAHPRRSRIPDGHPCVLHHLCLSGDNAGEYRPPLHRAFAPEAGVRGCVERREDRGG
ncbi:hypothetical protein INS49_005643 [Diaporthe citri]|uniref:uncharacterized protein n=1 Tax=Diaporthe citri TaxID=83186 RepID=UPI001C81AE02|nr:uncharacterized protein INS49_005643 [Diaporthe citri]KAG6353462.1 hypothetical protein INS49_005643 [Diaporthe citri]